MTISVCASRLLSTKAGHGRLRPRHWKARVRNLSSLQPLVSPLLASPHSLFYLTFRLRFEDTMFIINWFWDVLAQLGVLRTPPLTPALSN